HEAQDLPTYLGHGARRVLLIEAHPVLAERLGARFAGDARITVAHAAIGDIEGPVTLHVTSREASSSLLPLGKHAQIYPHIVEAGTLQVPGATLDRLLDGRGLRPQDFNVMTIDVQGAELKVLRGAAGILKSIDAVRVEVNFDELY